MPRVSSPDALRGLAILLVIAVHAFGYLGIATDGNRSWAWLAVSQIAVPCFFLADGWIYAAKTRTPPVPGAARAFLRSSAVRLLVPWLIFSPLYLAFRLASEATGHAHGVPALPHGAADLPRALWLGTAAAQLYFLPGLFMARCAFPALRPLVRGRPLAAVALAAGVVAGWRLVLEPVAGQASAGPPACAALGLGFAAIGWALVELEANGLPDRSVLAAAATAAILAFLFHGVGGRTIGQVGYLLFAWWLARITVGLSVHRRLAWLGSRTMEIFLLHLPWPLKVVSAAMLASRAPVWLALPLTVAAVAAISLIAASALRRMGLQWLWTGRLPALHASRTVRVTASA